MGVISHVAIPLYAMMLLIPSLWILPEETQGLSVSVNDVDDFKSGTISNTCLTAEGVTLVIDEARLDNWTRINDQSSGTEITCRYYPSMAYDRMRDNIILFGGKGNGIYYFNDTYIFSRPVNHWIQKNGTGAPPKTGSMSMAYDDKLDRMMLFGGVAPPKLSNQTWVYDITNDTWSEMKPSTFPSGRYGYSLQYHGGSGAFVLFGGKTDYSLNLYSCETWAYYLSNNTWINITPQDSPPARYGAGMVYYDATDEMVMFGGYDGKELRDTWIFNMTSLTWVRKYPSPCPSARLFPGMVYDSKENEIFLYGGIEAYDNWRYNCSNNTWWPITPVAIPNVQPQVSMVYDEKWGETVLMAYDINTWAYNDRCYYPEGYYISPITDTGGISYFGSIGWDAVTDNNTTLNVQFKSAIRSTDLDSIPFTGPGLNETSFYTTPGDQLNKFHNKSRYFQYKVILQSLNNMTSPLFTKMTIYYNVMQNITVTSPKGMENWTGISEITWTASDIDNDKLSFDILLENSTTALPLANGLPDETRSWTWNTTMIPNGSYKIRITAWDNNSAIPISTNSSSKYSFTIFHPPPAIPPNNPPSATLLEPEDMAVINSSAVDLSWNGSDPDGDTIRYSLFLSPYQFDLYDLPPALIVVDGKSFRAGNLSDATRYFWTVVPNDGKVDGDAVEIRSFSVRIPPVNRLPTVKLLYPADASIIGSRFINLSWTGQDPDNDPVGYFVFLSNAPFDSDELPSPIAFVTKDSYSLQELANGTTYYWTVVPTDGKGNGSADMVRHFLVDLTFGNHPPRFTSVPLRVAEVGKDYLCRMVAIDDDNDSISYHLLSEIDGMTLNSTTGDIAWTPTAAQAGNRTVIIEAWDDRGGKCEQAFVVNVKSPPIPIVRKPICRISAPQDKSKVRQVITITGATVKADREIIGVEVRIDGKSWINASGTDNWTMRIDTTRLKDGAHVFEARAFDGLEFSDLVGINLTVNNKEPGRNKGFIPAYETGASVLIILILAWRRMHSSRSL